MLRSKAIIRFVMILGFLLGNENRIISKRVKSIQYIISLSFRFFNGKMKRLHMFGRLHKVRQ